MFSPTGYYAHYRTRFIHSDGTPGVTDTEVYPVVGYTDTALILDGSGTVMTVDALLKELREGGDEDSDGDGVTWKVTLEVNGAPA
jgi:hypothetical protein